MGREIRERVTICTTPDYTATRRMNKIYKTFLFIRNKRVHGRDRGHLRGWGVQTSEEGGPKRRIEGKNKDSRPKEGVVKVLSVDTSLTRSGEDRNAADREHGEIVEVFIDTNVFVSFLTQSEKSKDAKKLLEKVIADENALVTSMNVIEETLYILTREILEEKGISGTYSARKYVSAEGYNKIEKELSKFISMINELDICVLDVKIEIQSLTDMMYQFHLLPNDALIAATCQLHGVTDIATFDDDFRQVDSLTVVKL